MQKISQTGLTNICRLICTEIQIYKELLNRAVTLNSNDKQKSLQDLGKWCDMDIINSDCLLKSPSYSNKLDVGNSTLLEISKKNQNIAFVHKGKCGGSSAGSMIRRRCTFSNSNKCDRFVYENEHKNTPANETQISLQVQECFHQRSLRRKHRAKYTSFIVKARNPVYRLISWYLHLNPLNGISKSYKHSKVHACYSQVDNLATKGLSNIGKNNVCQKIAAQFIKSNKKFNYYAGGLMRAQKEIFVLRAEHFWDDWQQINYMLGGGKASRVDSITHYKCYTPVESMLNLCRHLYSDIQWYKNLINSGVNLSDEDKIVSFEELKKTCPFEALRPACPKGQKLGLN